MSKLFDDASLAMIPSAYKDGKLYSIRPTDGSGDFTFSRGSNLAATRVDVNGLIEKGRENLLVQSNQFDTTWSNVFTANVVGGQSGYDGSNNAWTLETQSGQASRRAQNVSGLDSVNSFSVYAKANTLDWTRLQISTASGNYVADFDLTNGVSGFTFNDPLPSIESVGNGWYRVKISGFSVPTQVRIYALSGNNDVSGAGTIFIQNSQIERGLVASEVITTGASTAQAGILEDMPRLDYSGGASCPSLLLEPSRTNIVNNSEYVTGYFSQASAVVTYNEIVSPEGVQNAFKLTSTTNGQARIEKSRPVGGTDTYTLSVFFKAGNSNYASLANFNRNASVRFNLADGTIQGSGNVVDADIIPIGSDGWYRCYMTMQETSGQTANIYKILVSSDGETYFANNGDYVYAYGAQLELGSYPTSYIPTYGTSQTRSGDAASLTGVADLLGDANGTLFVEVETFEDNAHITLSDGTLANNFPFRFRLTNFQNDMKVDNVSQGNIVVSSTSTNTRYKVASRYSLNDRAVYFNGVLQDTDSNNEVFPEGTLTRIAFDRGDNAAHFYGRVYQLAVFPTALTNAELAALTL